MPSCLVSCSTSGCFQWGHGRWSILGIMVEYIEGKSMIYIVLGLYISVPAF